MRALLRLLPIAFAALASMPAVGQEAPRVIFCMGSCLAVDQNGVRTPAPKGTTLREGQRLETGAGAYAQLKLGQDAALGVSERAQVRFDQRSVRDRDLVMLDQGRIRILSGEAIGKAATRALELRTQDGTFALRGADVEVRRSQATTGAGSSLTVVKVNAGDARLLSPQGGIAISKDGVQGIAAGNVVTDKSISLADVALAPSRAGVAANALAAPVVAPVRDLPVLTVVAPPPTLLQPGLTLIPLSPTITSVAPLTITPLAPVVSGADKVLLTPVVNPVSPTTITTLTKIVTGATLAPATSTITTNTLTAPTNSTIFLPPPTTLTAPTTLRLCRIPPC
jgi:hypothetical protein